MPSPPQPTSKGRTAPTGKAEKTEKADTSGASAFAERMAKLENKAASQQEEAALERLRKKPKAAGSGRAGMPSGSGSESGSAYTAYVQSRLKDAFYQTITYTSKNPVVAVRLYIDTDGKVVRQKIEKSSGDRTFELAVLRAIEKAGDKLVPPPNHKVFEGSFLFKPQGISRNKQ
jgi:colicin import membrane protein